MIPPWLGVATISKPGAKVSDQSILPQGEKSGVNQSPSLLVDLRPNLGHIRHGVLGVYP